MTGHVLHRSDDEGSRMGMWLFLFSELLLFGGLFILYSVYLVRYQADFLSAGKELDTVLGTANTVVLLTSSLFVALAVTAMTRDERKFSLVMLVATILCAAVFLAVKYVEWGHKFSLGIFPSSPALAVRPKGEVIFFSLYYAITGLHAIHVIAGAIVLSSSLILILRGKVHAEKHVFLENSGLYWHLVDIIWIFIFPLFYLIV